MNIMNRKNIIKYRNNITIMIFSKESKILISFLIDNNCLDKSCNMKKNTEMIFEKMYKDIDEGKSYINSIKNIEGNMFYKMKFEKINMISQIPIPKTFDINSFPKEIEEHIKKSIIYNLSYMFSLFDRKINIYFLLEDKKIEKYNEYNEYVDRILIWLYIVNKYSKNRCGKTLDFYIYFTSKQKLLPNSSIDILGKNHVNTAFTYTCVKNAEIVIFRKEEWFKVLIHETFHSFSLDFSEMNVDFCNEKILSLFPVNSEVRLYESYTEFWARIMNICFCSYFQSNKIKRYDYLMNVEKLMNIEVSYSLFQMLKVLNFMGLDYSDLYSKNKRSIIARKNQYKEKSSILAYYIITSILIFNYEDFMEWCKKNNNNVIVFKKTISNLNNFCDFIEIKYKSKRLIEFLDCLQDKIDNIINKRRSKKNREFLFIINNIRMTSVEMD
jgi:hypothetical protein